MPSFVTWILIGNPKGTGIEIGIQGLPICLDLARRALFDFDFQLWIRLIDNYNFFRRRLLRRIDRCERSSNDKPILPFIARLKIEPLLIRSPFLVERPLSSLVSGNVKRQLTGEWLARIKVEGNREQPLLSDDRLNSRWSHRKSRLGDNLSCRYNNDQNSQTISDDRTHEPISHA